MPTVRCRMTDCVNWDEGYCSASRISIDDEGLCLTYSVFEDTLDGPEEEVEWDEVEDEEDEEDLHAADDDFDSERIIRGRRRWNDW